MELFSMVALVVGLVIGAAAGWVMARSRRATDAALHRAALAEARAEAERARAESDRARADVERVRTEFATVQWKGADAQNAISEAQVQAAEALARTAEVSSQLAAMRAERDAARGQIAALEADSARMLDQFRLASHDALEKQGKVLDQSAADRLRATEQVMAPVTELLKDFQTRLTQVEKERISIAAELRQQVQTVTDTGEALRRETHALATALRKPQVRGAWGELQLKRVVEMAGMLDHCDFLEQATTLNSNDATIRPDLKVLFGDDKFVYVDSKVPLSAFLDAQSCEDEVERVRHLQVFGRNVRTHIDQLSAKEYWRSGVGSPEFVVMFVPAEALFAEAMSQMPDLHEYANRKSVVIATPSSLIGMLRTVAYSWKQAALADSAAEVLGVGRELYSRLATMGGHADKLGKALTSSVKAYNDTVGSLEGRVFVQARRLRDLQVTDQELPQLSGVDAQPRALTAPELLEQTPQLDSLVDLRRSLPSTEDLVESSQPRLLEERRRRSAT